MAAPRRPAERAGAVRGRRRVRHPRRDCAAGAALDAAQRAGMAVPARAGNRAACGAATCGTTRASSRTFLPAHRGWRSPPRTVRHGPLRHHGGSTDMSVVTTERKASHVRPTLPIGDIVEVRPAEEILAGLDDRGELDSLPFMPEMLRSAAGGSSSTRSRSRRGHRHLDGPAPVDGHRASRGRPLRRRGTRRLPGGLPHLLEDRLARPRLRADAGPASIDAARVGAARAGFIDTPGAVRAIRGRHGRPSVVGVLPLHPGAAHRGGPRRVPPAGNRLRRARLLVPGHRTDPRGAGRHPTVGPDAVRAGRPFRQRARPSGSPWRRQSARSTGCRT